MIMGSRVTESMDTPLESSSFVYVGPPSFLSHSRFGARILLLFVMTFHGLERLMLSKFIFKLAPRPLPHAG